MQARTRARGFFLTNTMLRMRADLPKKESEMPALEAATVLATRGKADCQVKTFFRRKTLRSCANLAGSHL